MSKTLALVLLTASKLYAQGTPHLAPLRAKVGFENVGMPFAGETMGLAGLSLIRDFSNGAYLGVASYGSLTGERGGFITAGVSAGYRLPVGPRFTFDIGAHVGGGGAGRAAVGGGLMLRAHAGFDVRAAGLLWGAEVAKLRFPNGRIDSSEVSFSVALPFRAWIAPGERRAWSSSLLPRAGFGDATLAFTAQSYRPRRDVRLLSGPMDQTPVDLVGLSTTAGLNGWSFVALDMAAAGRGKADGYMEVLLGLGARLDLLPSGALRAVAKLSAGPAGGGNLDVGGGAAFRGTLGLEARLGHLVLGAETGYLTTPSASFKARTYGVSVGRTFAYARPGGEPLFPNETLIAHPWRLRFGMQRLRAPQRRNGAPADPIDLVGIQADSFLHEHAYFTGQGLFAMDGKAGGFAMGLLGAGLRSPALGPRGPRAFLEVLAGAAGGGGVDTGGGALLLPMAGLEQDLGRGLALQIKGGRALSRRGTLRTDALEASLGWRFGLLERR